MRGKDFIAYIDDNEQKREVWCTVLKVESFITIKLDNGKDVILPPHRVLKVKMLPRGI